MDKFSTTAPSSSWRRFKLRSNSPAITPRVMSSQCAFTSSPAAAAVKLKPSSGFWKRAKPYTKTVLIMLLPPVLAALLIKSTAFLSGALVLFRGLSFLSHELSPVVMTSDGPVQGKLAYSRNGSSYWEYLSIPYAQPPTGQLRFQPPVPVLPWKEVRQGLRYPPGCVQFEPVALGMSWGVEDCLFLNVFTPRNAVTTTGKTPSLPVIVFIYGGAFVEGESSFYRPDYIMDHNVVVVTFNYRLGPLGFLNFQEKNDTSGKFPLGNMGLKDQNLVLKWIKRNIAQFGGGNSITLMGESAGAVSVNLQMLSPLSKGLFHRAVAISGSSLCPWGFSNIPRQIAFDYGSRLGCPTDNADSLLQCYMSMEPHEMVKLQFAWGNPIHVKDEFTPSVEPVQSEDAFLTSTPIELLDNGDSLADIPLLTGYASAEGGLRSGRFRAYGESIQLLEENWDELIGNVLFLDEPLPREAAQDLRKFYFGNQNFTQDIGAFFDGITKLTSDSLFVEPVYRAAVYHVRSGHPTYFFYYDYKPTVMPATFSAFSQTRLNDNFVSRWAKLLAGIVWDWIAEFVFGGGGAHRYGIGHAEDVFQVFNILGLTKWITWLDLDFSTNLIKSIVDFANYTEPLTFRGTPWPLINDNFSRSSLDGLPYMKLDHRQKAEVIFEPLKERMHFWETLRLKHAKI